jgi:Uncharacterized conserved protein
MKGTAQEWDESKPAVENARLRLPEMAERYFAEGNKVVSKAPAPERLHELRLATKHFRYTLELFRPLYGPGLEDRIGRLRKVQQLLGSINDAAVTRRLLDPKPDASAAIAFLDRRIEEKITEFQNFWKKYFGAPGERESWVRYLRLYAGKRTKRTVKG